VSGDQPGMVTLLSVAKAAEILDCTDGHVYNLIADGELSTVNIARSSSTRSLTKIRSDDIAAYIDAHTLNAKRLRSVRRS
jgi:excisionase family DNA binding protein